jgi:hypothetical protein
MFLEGIVEQGQIKLDSDGQLPGGMKVYIVAPDIELNEKVYHLRSPRLARPEQISDFDLEAVEK